MTDKQRRPGCLDANMLAEFIDGGLEPRERAGVEAHLAECGECYETFAETVKLVSDAAPVKAPAPVRAPWRFMPAASGIAAAVLLAVAAWSFWPTQARALDAAMRKFASATEDARFASGRVSGGARWSPAPQTQRGAATGDDQFQVQTAARALAETAAGATNARGQHATGLAALALGDVAGAVTALDAAVRSSDSTPAIESDLAAALIERGRRTNRADDLRSAVTHAEKADRDANGLAEARFNRALALELLGELPDARLAWEAFLKLDASSQWAQEANAHLNTIRR